MNTLTETEKAYLAGLVDGEGCIHISKYQSPKTPTPIYILRVVISQSDKPYLEYWQEKVGVGSLHENRKIRVSLREEYINNARIGYAWHLSSTIAAEFLETIKEYLIFKKDQAELALEFQSTISKRHMGSIKGNNGGIRVPPHIIRKREKLRIAVMRNNQGEISNERNDSAIEGEDTDGVEQLVLFS